MTDPIRVPERTRQVLLLDAVTSAAMGVLLAAATEPLAPRLGLPIGLLRGAGIGLLPFAAWLVYVAHRRTHDRGSVRLVAFCNVAWVAASLILLLIDWVHPTTLGIGFVLAQAAAVAVFAWLEVA